MPKTLRLAAERGRSMVRGAKARAVSVLSRGTTYHCPFCGRSFRRLLPLGSYSKAFVERGVVPPGYRENAACPRCHSMDRERHIFLYLLEAAESEGRPVRLLHFAPERNLGKALASRPGMEYTSVDIASEAMSRMDITSLGFREGAFDAMICSHVLEHVRDDGRAMSELFRVLSPGGWAIIQVPISMSMESTYEDDSIVGPEERRVAFGQCDHVRIYGADYVRRLEDAGFSVTTWSYAEEHSIADSRRYGLLEGERLFVCRKPR